MQGILSLVLELYIWYITLPRVFSATTRTPGTPGVFFTTAPKPGTPLEKMYFFNSLHCYDLKPVWPVLILGQNLIIQYKWSSSFKSSSYVSKTTFNNDKQVLRSFVCLDCSQSRCFVFSCLTAKILNVWSKLVYLYLLVFFFTYF